MARSNEQTHIEGSKIGFLGSQVHIEKAFFGLAPDGTRPRRSNRPSSSVATLPAQARPFLGREQEVKKLTQLLTSSSGLKIVAINGEAGIGKTALAVHVAQQLHYEGYFSDPPLYVDLLGFNQEHCPLTPFAALRRLIIGLSGNAIELQEDEELASIWRERTKGKRLIVVLDNAHSDEQIKKLLLDSRDHRRCAIVVTSRNILATGYTVSLGQMSRMNARLLILRTANEREVARLDTSQADRLAEICCYVPSAMLITAADLKINSARNVDRYLEQFADELTRKNRFQAVAASIAISLQSLRDGDKIRWESLAVFAGSFDEAAAKAIWQVEDGTGTLDELHRRNLLQYDDQSKNFIMSSLLSDLALSALRERMVAEITFRIRHSAHFLNLLGEIERQLIADPITGIRSFDLWRSNILAGQSWAAAHVRELDDAERLLIVLVSYTTSAPRCLSLLGSGERIRWLQTTVSVLTQYASAGAIRLLAEARLNLGTAFCDAGALDASLAVFGKALRVARHQKADGSDIGTLIKKIAIVRHMRGQNRRALKLFTVADAKIGDCGWESDAEFACNWGDCLTDWGMPENATVKYSHALTACKQANDRISQGHVLDSWARALIDLRRYDEALEKITEAIEIGEQLRSTKLLAECYNALALCRLFSGGLREAQNAAETACYHQHDRHAYLGVDSVTLLGISYLLQGDIKNATPQLKKSLEIANDTLAADGRAFWKLFGTALSKCALAHCQKAPSRPLAEIESYKQGCAICSDAGVLNRIGQLHKLISTARQRWRIPRVRLLTTRSIFQRPA